MKKKILLAYAVIMTAAAIVLSVFLAACKTDKEVGEDPAINSETSEYEAQPTLIPTPQPTATPSPAPTPSAEPAKEDAAEKTTDYVPTEEDLAFKEQVISEGKTITLEISEWDMIDIMCDKLGWDEYHYRINPYEDEEDFYWLAYTRDADVAVNYYYYGLDSKTGNIIEDMSESSEYVSIGNIFTMEVLGEPYRRPEDDVLVEMFIDRILGGKLQEGAEVEIIHTQDGDIGFEHFETTENGRKFIKEYWLASDTREITGDNYYDVYGILYTIPEITPEYTPTKEDLAFKKQVISEGKTITLEISEWDMTDIMCDKLGKDEYSYRLVENEDEEGLYYLACTRNIVTPEQYIVYQLDTKTGDIFYEEYGIYKVGNIFTMEVTGEPFRLPEDDVLIGIFIDRILDGKLPEGTKVEVAHNQSGNIVFLHKDISEGKTISEYLVHWNTWNVFKDDSNTLSGKLFDE